MLERIQRRATTYSRTGHEINLKKLVLQTPVISTGVQRCSNWVDFVKSGCEKSWAEVQADSFSFECRGCMRMKELEVELEQLRLLIVAVVGREQVGCDSR